MNVMFVEHFTNAYHTLKRTRARTLLTVLGITIGIASVTCILAISDGVKHMMNGQVDSLDGHLAIIRPGLQARDPNAMVNPVAQQSFSTSTLTEADVEALTGMEDVRAVVPLMTIEGTIKTAQHSVSDNVVLATTYDFAKVSHLKMKSGQFLDENTGNSTAVIGEDLSFKLFDTDRPIGQMFTLRGQEFTVIGVIKRSDNPINFNNVDLNQAVIINFEQGKLFHQGRPQIQQIDMLASSEASLQRATSQAEQKLLKQHLGERDFTITSGADIAKPTNQLFSAVTDVMTAIAAISLVVGGVGVMNIMLVGVAERTREIGIRKAVGSSNGAIVVQFLIESLMMSVLGGVLGYITGYVIAFAISNFLYFTPTFTWQTAVIALGMAIVVGVVFGIYPALKAARKDTIESLRQYH